MFALVDKYRKWIMVGLFVLIIPPFAFFGIDQYFRDGGSAATVATVGDYEITEQEFSRALRERQEMLRNMSGGKIDPGVLDSTEQRLDVLDALVRQRVLVNHGLRSGLGVSADQLRAYIMQVPAFQDENKQFSQTRYQLFLKSREMTEKMFDNRLRHDLVIAALQDTYVDTSFVPRTVAERLARLTEQQREVSRAIVSPEKFASAVKLDDGAAKKYYDEQPNEFRLPEQVRVEYVTLSAESMLGLVQVDPNDVKKYYESNLRQFGTPETRSASHILIAADRSAPEADRQKARALAESISSELQKNPAKFAELAKKHSQDPGSAAKGGDLGTFPRGAMVKAFDDAVFSMKPGEVSAPVETEYGYHVIRLTGITPGETKPLDQVRPEIEREMKKVGAARKYAEVATELNNVVFEQSDTLQPAAKLLNQTPQKSGWITRNGAEDARLGNPKLLQAIFSDDVLNGKRNTEAIEVAPGTIVAARIIEHKPSVLRPFEEVKAGIEKKLVETRAVQLAAQDGRQKLEALRTGVSAQGITWSAPALVTRADPKGLAPAVVRQAFKADSEQLPSYTGVEVPGEGYVLLRISKVVEPAKADKTQQNQVGEALAQILGEEHFTAYVTSLKQKAKVKVNKAQVERKQ